MSELDVQVLRDSFAQPTQMGGAILAPSNWHEIVPKVIPMPTQIGVNTLQGIVDYIKADVDDLVGQPTMVHVVDERIVVIRGALNYDEGSQRPAYLNAAIADQDFPFGRAISAEAMIIGLQTRFVQTKERDDLVVLLGSIRENHVRETVDDGLSQEVKTQRGVTLVTTTRVPSPVLLAPFRTFREVEQPGSPFVVRLKAAPDGDQPLVTLHEADGGAWKIEAVARIAAWLRDQLPMSHIIA